MKFFTGCFLLITMITGCDSKNESSIQPDPGAPAALIAADKAFSAMSESKGMKTAFIEYIDSNGVLLRPNHLPIIGANAIDYLIQQNDTGYTLTWEPQHAEVARSGEMGFTFGIYAMRPKEKDTILYGSYTSIWKKQKDGSWKLLLDCGTDGIGEQP